MRNNACLFLFIFFLFLLVQAVSDSKGKSGAFRHKNDSAQA